MNLIFTNVVCYRLNIPYNKYYFLNIYLFQGQILLYQNLSKALLKCKSKTNIA